MTKVQKKKEEEALDNKEYIQTNSKEILKNWKKQEKTGKNMAIFSTQILYSPVISRKHILRIKK